MKVDIAYMASNRCEFTKISLMWLLHTLDFDCINKLYLIDDSSEDGTTEHLVHMNEFVFSHICNSQVLRLNYQSMTLSFTKFLTLSETDVVLKLDNDFCPMEKGWLANMTKVMENNPKLCCLGTTNPRMSVHRHMTKEDIKRGYKLAKRIGGIGLFRRDMFDTDRMKHFVGPKYAHSGIGWAQVQDKRKKGWFVPPFEAVLLDLKRGIYKGNKILLSIHDKYEELGYGRENRKSHHWVKKQYESSLQQKTKAQS